MKFQLILEGRVKDITHVVSKLTFMASEDAVILADDIDSDVFELSRTIILGSRNLKYVTKENPGIRGALTLSPSRSVKKSEFSLAKLNLIESKYVGNKTVIILDDDTYLSTYVRSMAEYGILETITIAGYELRPYENMRVYKDGIIFIKETGHYVNVSFD